MLIAYGGPSIVRWPIPNGQWVVQSDPRGSDEAMGEVPCSADPRTQLSQSLPFTQISVLPKHRTSEVKKFTGKASGQAKFMRSCEELSEAIQFCRTDDAKSTRFTCRTTFLDGRTARPIGSPQKPSSI